MRPKIEGTHRREICEWIETRLLQPSESLRLYMEFEELRDSMKAELDEVSGWGRLLRTYLRKSAAQLRLMQGLLLTGSDGCGKHTAAWQAVKYLTDESGWLAEAADEDEKSPFVYVNIRAAELEELSEEYIQTFLEYILVEKQDNLCLVLEFPENCPVGRRLMEYLGECIIRCRFDENAAALFLIVISGEPSAIPQILRRQLQLCRMQVPDEPMRNRFWGCVLENEPDLEKWLLGCREEDMMGLSLLDITEGMTYLQMKELCEVLLWAMESEDRAAAESLLRGEIRRICPEKRADESRKGHLYENDMLCEKIGALLDWIPEFSAQLTDLIKEGAVQRADVLQSIPKQQKQNAGEEYTAYETADTVDSKRKDSAEFEDTSINELNRMKKDGVDIMDDNLDPEQAFDKEKIIEEANGMTLADIWQ